MRKSRIITRPRLRATITALGVGASLLMGAAAVQAHADPPQSPLVLTTAVDVMDMPAAGQDVNYTFTVTNNGTTDLTDLTVATTNDFSHVAAAATCATQSLAIGASTTCHITYTVTDDDVARGYTTSTTIASGTDPSGATVTSDQSGFQIIGKGTLTLATTADQTTLAVGKTITYMFTVSNTGTAPITNLAVTNLNFTGLGTLAAAACPVTDLLPGASTTCKTSYYFATNANAPTGKLTVTNFAHATNGPGPCGLTGPAGPGIGQLCVVTFYNSNQTTLTIAPPPLVLTSSIDATDLPAAGQDVNYTFMVTNNSTTALTGLTVATTNSFSHVAAAATCATQSLAVGASTTCHATYTVTADDITRGYTVSNATASGIDSTGATIDSNEAGYLIQGLPVLTLTTTADKTALVVGQTINYSFAVANTGTAQVTDLVIRGDAFTGAGTLPKPICLATDLMPGASTTCTTSYVVTSADQTRGTLTTTSTANATNGPIPCGPTGPTGNIYVCPGLDYNSNQSTLTIGAAAAGPAIDTGGIVDTSSPLWLVGMFLAISSFAFAVGVRHRSC
ncbi:MAG: hypothetical protein FWD63_08145 [Propionibacteriaceae bacterium]|nr:hypothetical protein [Propionibacteriaceae bacterium]